MECVASYHQQQVATVSKNVMIHVCYWPLLPSEWFIYICTYTHAYTHMYIHMYIHSISYELLLVYITKLLAYGT